MAATHLSAIVILILAIVVTYTTAALMDVCQWETFEARCQDDEVILLKKANYGRMRVGRCQPRNYFVGCSTDVTPIMHARCSGHQKCSVPVPDPAMFAATPCPKDLVTYLQADYECVKVNKAAREQAIDSGSDSARCDDQILTDLTGYISNPVVNASSSACPHRILAQPGQTINVYLYTFNNNNNSTSSKNETTGSSDCISYYGHITEAGSSSGTADKICGGAIKTNHLLYSSTTNVVDISLLSNHTQKFLLRYQVVGCPTFQAPANSWVTVKDNIATVRCNFSSTVGNVVCADNQWLGELQNCTAASAAFTVTGSVTDKILSHVFANSDFIVFCIGLALAILCGTALLMIAATFLGTRQKASSIDGSQAPIVSEKAADINSYASSEMPFLPVDQYEPLYMPVTVGEYRQKEALYQQGSLYKVSLPGTLPTITPPTVPDYCSPLDLCVPTYDSTYGIVISSKPARDLGHSVYDMTPMNQQLTYGKLIEIDSGPRV